MMKQIKNLIDKGFYIFPIATNKKVPMIKDFTNKSTNDFEKAKTLFFDPILEIYQPYNIGIATTKFKKNESLLVIDVDNKGIKKGSDELVNLELDGFEFPKTMQQYTPTGGLHLIYKIKTPLKQGVNVLANGLDTRSKGGYIVAAGSKIDGKTYTIDETPIADAPKWLVEKIATKSKKKDALVKDLPKDISQNTAIKRAKDFLQKEAPIAIEGDGGDQTTFVVASRLKDLGVTFEIAVNLMSNYWNDNCIPPWTPEQLETKIRNAYLYGQNVPGVDSPEMDFGKIETPVKGLPVDELNKEFSFCVLGGQSTILRKIETNGVSYMSVRAFHDLLKAEKMQCGDGKIRQLSEVWFSSPKRATYNEVALIPGKEAPPGVYNLWRGFSCNPLEKDETPTKEMLDGVSLFNEHALENICGGDTVQYKWLMGFFAHMIQKPWQKPLTALVFKGQKGVGKNVLMDRVGNLVSHHYLLTSNKRYLIGNFNKHLANLIFFVLDEAFWSGDKAAEGILKDLITGNYHLIEHKGREMYQTKNLTRIAIIGNEDWLVPATSDERRFAVFNVESNRRLDKKFFTSMRKLIDEKGGNRLLLRNLLDYDISNIDLNSAPNTKGLLEQKIESLIPIHAWWFSCLDEGIISNVPFQGPDWPSEIDTNLLRESYISYSKQRGFRYMVDASSFGRLLKKCCPSITTKRPNASGTRSRLYILPLLKDCRHQFETFIGGQKIDWQDEEILESNSNILKFNPLFQ